MTRSEAKKPLLDKECVDILRVLQQKGRISFRQLAREVGLSAPTVTERVERMEEAGIIHGYTARLDVARAGLPVRAIISMFTEFKDPTTRHFHEIASIPEVLHCYRVTGDCDYVLHVAAPTMEHLDHVLLRLSKFGKTRTSVVLDSEEKRDYPWDIVAIKQ